MTPAEILFIIFLLLGSLTILSYIFLLVQYNKKTVNTKKIWAIYNNWAFFIPWAASALISAVAFLVFSFHIPDTNPDTWLTCSYTIFLISSFLYAPFLVHDSQIDVIVILAIASASSISNGVWTSMSYGFDSPGNTVMSLGMIYVAFHCTVFDLILWGYSWCYWDDYTVVVGT